MKFLVLTPHGAEEHDSKDHGPVSRETRWLIGLIEPFLVIRISKRKQCTGITLYMEVYFVRIKTVWKERLWNCAVAFRAWKLSGTFEKRAPGSNQRTAWSLSSYLQPAPEGLAISIALGANLTFGSRDRFKTAENLGWGWTVGTGNEYQRWRMKSDVYIFSLLFVVFGRFVALCCDFLLIIRWIMYHLFCWLFKQPSV